jgi:DNA-binding transcriptional MerR regulator
MVLSAGQIPPFAVRTSVPGSHPLTDGGVKKPLDLELTPSDRLLHGGGYMKIAEVSERYGVSSDTLRYYERIGLIPPVNRNGGGIRDYGEIDVKRVEFIKCMRSAGLPIEVLIEYVGLVQQGDRTIEARKEILKEQRERLVARMAEMQKTLDLLNYKIGVYENAVLSKEKALVPKEDQPGTNMKYRKLRKADIIQE